MGWYSGNWRFRTRIVNDRTKVGGDQTDFTCYLNLSRLTNQFWANVKSDGGDIRVTKSDGVTEVPIDLVTITVGSKVGELHFKATGTLSASTDNTFYVYYGNASASGYAASATYGRNAVWTAYVDANHNQEDPSGTAPQLTNSTGGASFTTSGSMTSGDAVAGKLEGRATDFDGTNDAASAALDLSAYNKITWSAWLNWSSFSNDDDLVFEYGNPNYAAANGFIIDPNNTYPNNTFGVGFWTTNNVWYYFTRPSAGAFHLCHIEIDKNTATAADKIKVWVDGVAQAMTIQDNLGASGGSLGNTTAYMMSRTASALFGAGILDEMRMTAGTLLSSTWITTEYNNQNSPNTFWYVVEDEALSSSSQSSSSSSSSPSSVPAVLPSSSSSSSSSPSSRPSSSSSSSSSSPSGVPAPEPSSSSSSSSSSSPSTTPSVTSSSSPSSSSSSSSPERPQSSSSSSSSSSVSPSSSLSSFSSAASISPIIPPTPPESSSSSGVSGISSSSSSVSASSVSQSSASTSLASESSVPVSLSSVSPEQDCNRQSATIPQQIVNAIVSGLRDHMCFTAAACYPALEAAYVDGQPLTVIQVVPGAERTEEAGAGGQEGGDLQRRMDFELAIWRRAKVDRHLRSDQLKMRVRTGLIDLTEGVRNLFALTVLGGLVLEPVRYENAGDIEWHDVDEGVGFRRLTLSGTWREKLPQTITLTGSHVASDPSGPSASSASCGLDGQTAEWEIVQRVVAGIRSVMCFNAATCYPILEPTYIESQPATVIQVIPAGTTTEESGMGGQEGGDIQRRMSIQLVVWRRMKMDRHLRSDQILTREAAGMLDLVESLRSIFALTTLGGVTLEPVRWDGSAKTMWKDPDQGVAMKMLNISATWRQKLPQTITL